MMTQSEVNVVTAYLTSQFLQAGEFGSLAGRFALLPAMVVSCRQKTSALATVRACCRLSELLNSLFHLTHR